MELMARRAKAAGEEAEAEAERVRVSGSGGLFEVKIGARTYLVEAAKVREGARDQAYEGSPPARSHAAREGVLVYSFRIGGAQHEVVVRPRGDGAYWVSSRQGASLVEVADPLAHLAAQGAGGKGAKRRRRVTAYMPGRVVAILVAEGQEVAAGQGVLVLEAMKMQNEILAEHAGTVRRLLVEPGQSVDGGDPLFELE